MLDQFLETSNPTPHQTARLFSSHISHRERDDAYIGTIVQFRPRWRLILCKNQIQWIIQKKAPTKASGAANSTSRAKIAFLKRVEGKDCCMTKASKQY